ncbi:DUF4440 domain-containing protein [Agromyces protaetiae]|uniref:DUF4440 domain-containing protein n=1 Tax=Agromyces protaetiae TaxID=2509455 RepID=A0A4P6FHI0_9MICO|nr:nuclear transport factor 2 family protein [Agromyces protaetiae]QAY73989.1 DUF4440 domain-containing protein [Agromyces protaetiae]
MDVPERVTAQLQAYNARDIDAFAACFADDCIVEDAEGTLLMRGRAAMHESYGRMFAASPDLHCRIVSRIVVGDHVLDEERVTGRDGRDGESHVVAIYRVAGDLIDHVRFIR